MVCLDYAGWNADARTRPDDNCVRRVLVVGHLPCAVSHFVTLSQGVFEVQRVLGKADGTGQGAASLRRQ